MKTNSHDWLLVPGVFALGTLAVQTAHATQFMGVEQAQKALFPAATQFKPTLFSLTDEQRKQLKKASPTRTPLPEKSVWQAFAGDTHVGWFIVDEVFGKHEYITYAVAISNDGKVLGVEITDYRETKGDEVREKSWREQFIGKTAQAPLKLEQDISNISGATLSCLHIAEGVKRLLALHALVLRA